MSSSSLIFVEKWISCYWRHFIESVFTWSKSFLQIQTKVNWTGDFRSILIIQGMFHHAVASSAILDLSTGGTRAFCIQGSISKQEVMSNGKRILRVKWILPYLKNFQPLRKNKEIDLRDLDAETVGHIQHISHHSYFKSNFLNPFNFSQIIKLNRKQLKIILFYNESTNIAKTA